MIRTSTASSSGRLCVIASCRRRMTTHEGIYMLCQPAPLLRRHNNQGQRAVSYRSRSVFASRKKIGSTTKRTTSPLPPIKVKHPMQQFPNHRDSRCLSSGKPHFMSYRLIRTYASSSFQFKSPLTNLHAPLSIKPVYDFLQRQESDDCDNLNESGGDEAVKDRDVYKHTNATDQSNEPSKNILSQFSNEGETRALMQSWSSSEYDNSHQYSMNDGNKPKDIYDVNCNSNSRTRTPSRNKPEVDSLDHLLSNETVESRYSSQISEGKYLDYDEQPVHCHGEESLFGLLSDKEETLGQSLNHLIGNNFSRHQKERRDGHPDSEQIVRESNTTENSDALSQQEDSHLDNLPSKFLDIDQSRGDFEDGLLFDVLNDDFPESDTRNDFSEKQRDLRKLQLQLEIESTEEAFRKCLTVWRSARARSDHGTIPAVRKALTSWYGQLTEAIEHEQWLYLNGDYATMTLGQSNEFVENSDRTSDSNSKYTKTKDLARAIDRTNYGPPLCLLPAQKIAIILANTALSYSLVEGRSGCKVVSMALQIANALETEVNVSRALRVRAKKSRRWTKSNDLNNGGDQDVDTELDMTNRDNNGKQRAESDHDIQVTADEWVYTASHLRKFLDEISGNTGGRSGEQQSLGSRGRIRPTLVRRRCQEILLAENFFPSDTERCPKEQTSMNEFVDWDPVRKVKLGAALIQILLDHATFSEPSNSPEPAFSYERKKTDRLKYSAFVSIHPGLFRLAVEDEMSSIGSSSISAGALFSSRCQPMVIPPRQWRGINDGAYETIKVDFMRTRHCRSQKDALRGAGLSKVFEGLNVLGGVPWKINKKILDIAHQCWNDAIVLGDIPSKVDFEVPPFPENLEYCDYRSLSDEEQKVKIEKLRTYRDAITKHFRFKQKNMDLHSLRCSAMLKLNQAEKFRDFEEIYFPYNVDFRGRAYPVPPHLSIVGSDLCRALLMFARRKPLGPNGLYWLKVHLANLAGANKMSFDDRATFAEDNMDNIRAAVNNPFGENRWWMEFDDPFQGLATCHEIIQAIDSGDPESYLCSLPVHMDGSCNGLQHYAALGRDRVGGKAVNLCIADEPQDVYIGVMHEVIRRVAMDAAREIGFDENKSDLTKSEKELVKKVKSARLVDGLIDRGVVKRTVMTSVYGVTYVGARNQISEKIEEKLEGKGYDIDEMEPEIHMACGYLASLTMEVIGQLFTGARETMNWLTACARMIASQGQPVAWISPIGVPIVQPYRQKRAFTVVTLLQNIIMTNDSDTLPLHRTRQVSAFPPNYVHSLDSSHMLLTAIDMKKRGLEFSAVHDSYWTHPCDVEEMNVALRECFVDLYDRPLLEDLKKVWELRYPSLTFPDIPRRGDLDLDDVKSAPYFFQ